MIARVWHGRSKPENADAYEAMLKPELLPGLSKVKGYKGSYLLRRSQATGNLSTGDQASEVEFMTIILWESIDALRAFAGPDYETSIIPEERLK
jgi:heme-degrading monooxygenase HmoA